MSDSSHPAPEPHAPASQELAAADATEQGAPPPAGYDPADYRWVPVRRRPRYDGWAEEKQRRFVVLADTGLVSAAAKAVGMSREGANRLRRSPHGAARSDCWIQIGFRLSGSPATRKARPFAALSNRPLLPCHGLSRDVPGPSAKRHGQCEHW